MSEYIGITIGPIEDTLMQARTPAMMWYASFLFSRLTEEICSQIRSRLPGAEILSPYFPADSAKKQDGIGRYHDRIIVKTGDTSMIQQSINKAKGAISAMILQDLSANDRKGQQYGSFFAHFFSIHWAKLDIRESENAILKLGNVLDALEQMLVFNQEIDANPLTDLFTGKEGDKNEYIRKSSFLPEDACETTQLFSKKEPSNEEQVTFRSVSEKEPSNEKKMTFRSISEIAGTEKPDFKKFRYYAVVYADVDNMGRYLASIGNTALTEFSENCIAYTSSAAEIIGSYGGMTIYAGGDDLLFLAPVESEQGRNLFDLLQKIHAEFQKTSLGKDGGPTLSFGVAIRYYKFPLYEAFAAARNALFGAAKNTFAEKNAVVVDFQKHSGQCGTLYIPMEKMELFYRIFTVFDSGTWNSDVDETVNSVIYLLESLHGLLRIREQAVIKNVFVNMFDSAGQKTYKGFLQVISDLYWEYTSDAGKRNIVLLDAVEPEKREAKTFAFLLRLAKFMKEKGEN